MQTLWIGPRFSASCLLYSTAVPTNSFFSLCIPWFSEMFSSSLVIRKYLAVCVKKLSSSTEWVIIFSVLADCGIFFPMLWGATVCSLLFPQFLGIFLCPMHTNIWGTGFFKHRMCCEVVLYRMGKRGGKLWQYLGGLKQAKVENKKYLLHCGCYL